ncbi:class I SAM-dependent methyltransferase [Salmonella enterica subsp. enterica]|nr:class I SAM-dependent methyltransferase [Salmonella enterica subsp. enterica]EDP8717581.1 class I SAM-dependent methyltransferase [Salmonella enterica subsp. enterica]
MSYFNNKISETLLIPLVCKAEETQQTKPIIRDYMACSILKKINIDTDKYKKKRISRVGTALRTKFFDSTVSEFIDKNKHPVIINLGCGLDTRYYRLKKDITYKAHFYYIDLLDVIELRRQLLPEKFNETYIPGSILNDHWVNHIKQRSNNNYQFLFLLEGLVMYFSEEDVMFLFNVICQHFKSGFIVFDTLNKWLSMKSEAHDTVKYTDVNFIFGLDNDKTPATWNEKLSYIETKKITDYKEHKRIGFPLSILMRYIEKYNSSVKMITYQIQNQV